MLPKQRPSPTSSKDPELTERLSAKLGDAARAARRRVHMTQKAVAKGVGLSAEVYGRMERGGVLPSLPTLWKLCTFLRLSADEALGLTEDAAPPDGQAPPRASPLLMLLLDAARPLDAQRLQVLIQLATLLREPSDPTA